MTRMVMIEWVDSTFAHGWMDRETLLAHTQSECVSCGLLMCDKKDSVTIIQSFSPDKKQVGDGITIPKCCIKRVRTLKVK